MHSRLYKFLDICDVLHPLMFGFREKHCTDHALISLTEKIKTTIDNKKIGCSVFIDLKKAFDTVNHSILLKKLEHYGVRGVVLNWFCSYLKNRRQYVSVNGHTSKELKVTCGVPQGSVLGPILFLVYINDLPSVSKILTFYLFADDTNIYYESSNTFDLQRKMYIELKKVKKWLDANRLALNIEKTKFVLFHSPTWKSTDPITIRFGRKKVCQEKFVKFLGVLLDETPSFRFHLAELSKKLSRVTGIFFKCRHLLPLEVLKTLYYAMFFPFIQYGIVVWGLT